jgi:hypothetical protein
MIDMRDISLTTVQACVLLGTLCYVDGRSDAEAVYCAAAVRLGHLLDLPRRPCLTALERQINLRGEPYPCCAEMNVQETQDEDEVIPCGMYTTNRGT